MNNEELLQKLVKDKNDNYKYFKDIKKATWINREVRNKLGKYISSLQEVLSEVNVTKVLPLYKIKEDSNYFIVLSNRGIKERYIANSYAGQSTTISTTFYFRHFKRALKLIFESKEISKYQKEKIKDLKNINTDGLDDIETESRVQIENVKYITNNLELKSGRFSIPHFSFNYGMVSDFVLLSIRSQIEESLNEFLEEREKTIEFIDKKQKELEGMYPLLFMFGGK